MWQDKESTSKNQELFYTPADIQRRRSWTHSHKQQSQKNKIPGINLAKEIQELYNKNLKLEKKQSKALENGKTPHVPGS